MNGKLPKKQKTKQEITQEYKDKNNNTNLTKNKKIKNNPCRL